MQAKGKHSQRHDNMESKAEVEMLHRGDHKESFREGLWEACVILLGLLLAASVSFTIYCGIGNYYLVNRSLQKVDQISSYGEKGLETTAGNILYAYLEFGFPGIEKYCQGNGLLLYSIYTIKGRRVGGTLPVSVETLAKVYTFTEKSLEGHPQAKDYRVKILSVETYNAKEKETSDFFARNFEDHAFQLFWGMVCGALSSVLLLLLEIHIVVGRKKESPLGRIPIELLVTAVGVCLYLLAGDGGLNPLKYDLTISIWAIRCMAFFALSVFFFLYFLRWLQREDWYRHTLLYWLYRGARRVIVMYICLFSHRRLIWKICILWGVLILTELIALVLLLPMEKPFSRWMLLGWVLEKLLLTPYLLYHGLVLSRIREAAHEIVSGNLNCQVRDLPVPGLLRELARDINAMSDSISIAVEDRIKSERLKTELITNVSHDIKTPLTSIINFADLIAKEESENPKIRDYAEHLYKQSSRMKKLIEDLMEASKASTGNMEINLELCDVKVLLGQCRGEYESRLEDQGLELVVKLCEEPILILADTKMLWRVFDNLMGNICKYTQRGTRVYLSAEVREDKVRITFKNISSYALDIPPEELMERFVRGDLSRHTEGNGLGLSIVRSLMDLQKGKIELAVDGDLFKAILEFPIAAKDDNSGKDETPLLESTN